MKAVATMGAVTMAGATMAGEKTIQKTSVRDSKQTVMNAVCAKKWKEPRVQNNGVSRLCLCAN